MKKCWICVIVLSLLLCGCVSGQPMETVSDEFLLSLSPPVYELSVQFPEGTSQAVLADDVGGALYFCEDYTIAVQTFSGGDLDRTLKQICGFETGDVHLLETGLGEVKRYDWIWSSAGEEGIEVGRGALLDDGQYHHSVSVMAPEAAAGALDEAWDAMFASMTLQRIS